jgi:ribonucleoside-diphosphate reductase alpha subunit
MTNTKNKTQNQHSSTHKNHSSKNIEPVAESPHPSKVDKNDMFVIKRSGKKEVVSFDKILKRIKKVGTEVGIKLNYAQIAIKIIEQLYDGITTTQIDELSAEQCASMSSIHPDYAVLAGRLIVFNHHKNTDASFTKVMKKLYQNINKMGKPSPIVSHDLYKFVCANAEKMDQMCDYSRDFLIDYFGFKTLEKSYLLHINRKILERPQHMWLRVAIGIHGTNMEKITETYEYMSRKYFIHATPTLFNAGTPCPQCSSCFLLSMESDSIEGIYNTLKDCALISKYAGGIGLHIHNIRGLGSHINGTNGISTGIVPMLRIFNATAKYVDQCLLPDTIVHTRIGEKYIKDIHIGDEVISIDGNYHTIGKILDYQYEGPLYSIQLENNAADIQMTCKHPLFAVYLNSPTPPHTVLQMLEHRRIEAEFVEAKQLTEYCYIANNIPTYEKDLSQYTEADCRFYGILLGAGYLLNSNPTCCYKILYKTDSSKMSLESKEFIQQYLQQINIRSFDDGKNIYWEKNSLFKFNYESIYDEKMQKYIMIQIKYLPVVKLLSFWNGYMESTCGIFSTTSPFFIESLRYIMMKIVHAMGCVYEFIPLSGDFFQIHKSDHYFVWKQFVFIKIKQIKMKENFAGRVLDIEVDETYTKLNNNVQDMECSTIYQEEFEHEHEYENDHDRKQDNHNFMTHGGLVKNGGGKRNGSIAIYLEIWHIDIEQFLEMRKNHGDEDMKARDLFYALWICDLFMERVQKDGNWTLMCPNECTGLMDVYGDDFNQLYTKYETEGRGKQIISARELWYKILDSQMETGTPYLLYKDACNRKSNQKNVGVIKSSNLCTEIIEYTNEHETAVCNLASIGLPTFVQKGEEGEPAIFQFDELHKIAKILTYNLNQIIDINFYPTEKTRRSNLRHRPIGIGVQGLADVFFMMGFSFQSKEARDLNKLIFETIYHGALEKSMEMAIEHGPYESFAGSPASQGLLQFDLWGVENHSNERYNWVELKSNIQKHGLRNSLLLAPMPTASTSQILGFNECFEPITSNIYTRRTLAGEFVVTNKYLMKELIQMGIWNEKVKNQMIANNGSVQNIDCIPPHVKEKYLTVWELSMKMLIDMACDRGIYICQSQSMNLWLENPNYNSLTSMHFYAWNKGLKTGIYYLRRRAKHNAQQFTIEPEKMSSISSITNVETKEPELDTTDIEICSMCSA